MKMQWFGEDWGAPVCETAEHVEIPIGQKCFRCQHVITHYDHGLMVPTFYSAREPWHLSCLMGNLLGSDWQELVPSD